MRKTIPMKTKNKSVTGLVSSNPRLKYAPYRKKTPTMQYAQDSLLEGDFMRKVINFQNPTQERKPCE